MKTHKLFIFLISVSLIIFFFVSCAIEVTSPRGEDDFADDEMVEPFERIDLGNSEYIAFYEPDPGDFLMFCAFNSDDKAESLKNKSPLEVYEHFMNKKPSTKLVEAFLRSESIDDQEADEETFLTAPAADEQSTRMSAEAFKEAYYDPSYGFWLIGILWPNVTGTGKFSRTCSEMISWAHPYRGTITHRVRWKNFWGTTKSSSNTLTQGQVGYAYSRAGYRRWREIAVYNADGDGYHASIFATY
ncbi:MAG: hypothetical protein JXJ04_26330 [Spirochaetales bacterium]|nr:hypothetical protein [Spirochaetales bacterium]